MPTSISSGTLGQPSFYKSLGLAQQGEPGYGRTASLIGAFNGINAAGAAIGAVVNAYSADKFSRKHTIQLGAMILVLGAALCAGSTDVSMFLVARFIAGLGIGILTSVIPMYQAEVALPEARGFMVSMHGVMFAVGYSLSAWIGYGVYFITASGSESTFPWRFPLAFQAVPALLLLMGSPFLPYSPRWLMQQGRSEEAHSILTRLHARKGEVAHDQAEKEFDQMRRQLELDRQVAGSATWYEVFRTAPNRRRALIATLMMWGNMFTGVLLIANYAVIIFTDLGLSGATALLLLSIWVSISLIGNIITALFIDQWGRRKFMLVGIGGIVVALTFECLLQALYAGTTNKAGQRAAVFFIYLFICFWSSCMDASQFLYLSEIWPTEVRGAGTAVGMTSWYCAQIVILVAGPIALNNITWRFFLVLIVPSTFYWFAIYFLFPETRQQSLEDLKGTFGERVAVHYHDATIDTVDDAEKCGESIEHKILGARHSGPVVASGAAVKADVDHVETAIATRP